jgi:hypothetical protein
VIEPRICWAPSRVSSLGQDCVAFWEEAGGQLYEWQKFWIDQILGIGDDGMFVTTDDGLEVARQNGKGVCLQALEVYFAFELGRRHGYGTILHTAHEFKTCEDHRTRLVEFVQACPHLDALVKDRGGYMKSNGKESINLKDGTRIVFQSRTNAGGRGFSADLLVWDEAMIISDRSVGAQKPMIRASKGEFGHKTIFAGSAVDREVHADGVNFARIRIRGLEQDPRVSYTSWSAPLDDPSEVTVDMLKDVELARAANPSMEDGLISEETILDEIRTMAPRVAAVELYGIGLWPSVDAGESGLFDSGRWSALAAEVVVEESTLSLDVSPLRTRGSIVSAKRVGDKVHIAVVAHEEGTGWLVERLAELVDELDASRVVIDERGPAAALIPALEAAGVVVETIGTTDYTRSCGMFFDAFEHGSIVHDGNMALEAAVRGAAQRTVADAWGWSRKHSRSDITPLVAATIAHWAEATTKTEQKKFAGVAFA